MILSLWRVVTVILRQQYSVMNSPCGEWNSTVFGRGNFSDSGLRNPESSLEM
ncbi:hypothetical protein Plhal304r1_c017g0062511 [Plasmopara halstedii]